MNPQAPAPTSVSTPCRTCCPRFVCSWREVTTRPRPAGEHTCPWTKARRVRRLARAALGVAASRSRFASRRWSFVLHGDGGGVAGVELTPTNQVVNTEDADARLATTTPSKQKAQQRESLCVSLAGGLVREPTCYRVSLMLENDQPAHHWTCHALQSYLRQHPDLLWVTLFKVRCHPVPHGPPRLQRMTWCGVCAASGS